MPPLSGVGEVKPGSRCRSRSVGGNRLKVTVPVGLNPPLTVAVSEMDVPTGPPADGVVAMVGAALVMVTGSSSQPGLTMGCCCWRHRCRWPPSGRCPRRWSGTGRPRWRWPRVSGVWWR